MAIIGNIIKKAIELKHAFSTEHHPAEDQQQVLLRLLNQASETDFGLTFDFHKMLESSDPYLAFSREVPLFDYEKLYKEWWFRIVDGQSGVTWPGRPEYFALTSGTTGSGSKRIPVTAAMLEAIRNAGLQQITSMADFDIPSSFYEKEIMMLHSSTNLKKNRDIPEGEISGISASNIPFWFRGFYKPGDQIGSIDDWEERLERISNEAQNWDIGALSGIPSWIELMIRKVISDHNLSTIHDIWPNLQVYTTGGVAFEPYRKSFESLLARPITIIDTYLASEGFLAFQARPDTEAMKLITDNGIYFEFIPFEDRFFDDNGSPLPDATVYNLSQVEEGQEYALLISTVSGTWRYLIGDTVRIENKEKSEIMITGRTKHFLNVVGSQLSVVKMNQAIAELENRIGISVPEFTVAAIRKDGNYIHKWYLGTKDPVNDTVENVSEELDKILQKSNKNYKVARSKALKGVEAEIIPLDLFYDWMEKQKKKGGQVKFPKVMKEEAFMKWESFLTNNKV